MLSIGSSAPEFQLSDQDGNSVNIKDLRAKKFFYGFIPGQAHLAELRKVKDSGMSLKILKNIIQ